MRSSIENIKENEPSPHRPNFVQLYRAQFDKAGIDKPIKVADFFGKETPSIIPFSKEEIDHDIKRINEWGAPDPQKIKRLEDLRGRERGFEGYEDNQRAEMATDYIHKNLSYGVGGWELSENRWVEGPDEQPLANIERYAHSPHAIEFTQDKSYAQGVVEDGGGVLVEENAPEGRVLNSIMGLRKIFKGIQKEKEEGMPLEQTAGYKYLTEAPMYFNTGRFLSSAGEEKYNIHKKAFEQALEERPETKANYN